MLTGCGAIGNALNDSDAVKRVLASVEGLNHALIGTRGLAREYRDADVDRQFRVNGFATPADVRYTDLAPATSPGSVFPSTARSKTGASSRSRS